MTGFVLALASGCGGSSGGGEINRESIVSCLRGANAEVREANARGIRPHEDGFFHLYYDHPTWELQGLVASIEDNDVAVVAVTGEDSVTGGRDEAGMAFSWAEMGLEQQVTPSKHLLRRYDNVVIEWSETPTDQETETLEGCVS